MFGIHRGYRRSSSSDEEPSSGGGPHRPGHRAHRVRRALFGPTDPEENLRFVRQELKKHAEIQNNRWNFDFQLGQPLKGRLEWEMVPKEQIHPAYKCSRLEYLSTHDESEQENLAQPPAQPPTSSHQQHSMLGHSALKTARTGSVDDLKTPSPISETPQTVPCSTNLPPGTPLPSSRSVPSAMHGLADRGRHHSSDPLMASVSTTGRPPDYRGRGGGSNIDLLGGGRSGDVRVGAALSQVPVGGGGGQHGRGSDQPDGPGPGSGGAFNRPHTSSYGVSSGDSCASDRSTAPVIDSSSSVLSSSVMRRQESSGSPLVVHHHPASGSVSSAGGGSRTGGGDGARPEGVSGEGSTHSSSSSTRMPRILQHFRMPSLTSSSRPRGQLDKSAHHLPPSHARGGGEAEGQGDVGVSSRDEEGSSRGDHSSGARPKTKDQKITDAFRSRKLSRSKSAGKLKRLGGGAGASSGASRSPSVKSRHHSRSTLPGPR